MAAVDVWLPKGHWTDIFTGDEYEGGKAVTMVRWLDSIPVLAKEGGFFVLDARPLTNDSSEPDRLDVQVYTGDGQYRLQEDVGVGKESSEIRFRTEAVRKGLQKTTVLATCGAEDADLWRDRDICLRFCNIPTGTVTVTADGAEYPAHTDDNGCLTVEIEGLHPGILYEILVSYEEKDRLDGYRERFMKTLTRLQMENDRKMSFYEAVMEQKDLSSEECGKLCAMYGIRGAAALRLQEQYEAWSEALRRLG